MAISANIVYRTVLLILNNEQRGYMTPDEFNKIGSQVQRQIFEAYFEDLNQQLRIPQSDMDYASRVAITDEKIAEFKTTQAVTHANGVFDLPTELYRLGSATYTATNSNPVEIQRTTRGDYYNINMSPLTAPSESFPVYLYEDNKIKVYPTSITSGVDVQFLKKPSEIRWGFYTGSLGQYINDPTVFGPDLINTGDGTLNTSANTIGITANDTTTPVSLSLAAGNITTSGNGTGLVISVEVTSNDFNISVVTAGTGFLANDTITIPQASLPGLSANIVITLSATDFNSGSTYGTTNFELHNSERTEVILKILLYSGIVIRDPSIIQVAAQKIQQEEVNEKS